MFLPDYPGEYNLLSQRYQAYIALIVTEQNLFFQPE